MLPLAFVARSLSTHTHKSPFAHTKLALGSVDSRQAMKEKLFLAWDPGTHQLKVPFSTATPNCSRGQQHRLWFYWQTPSCECVW